MARTNFQLKATRVSIPFDAYEAITDQKFYYLKFALDRRDKFTVVEQCSQKEELWLVAEKTGEFYCSNPKFSMYWEGETIKQVCDTVKLFGKNI